jgi:hypothetical protein
VSRNGRGRYPSTSQSYLPTHGESVLPQLHSPGGSRVLTDNVGNGRQRVITEEEEEELWHLKFKPQMTVNSLHLRRRSEPNRLRGSSLIPLPSERGERLG